MKYRQTLIDIISRDTQLMAHLKYAEQLNLTNWCIGAGAIRNRVWDWAHGFSTPTPLNDIDVVFFDETDLSEQTELDAVTQLKRADPNQAWDVVNQARVHLWYPKLMGINVPPITSLANGIATWPETATCVGAFIANDHIEIIAPLGLDDLFELNIRHNPTRVSWPMYQQRQQEKQFQAKWPLLKMVNP